MKRAPETKVSRKVRRLRLRAKVQLLPVRVLMDTARLYTGKDGIRRTIYEWERKCACGTWFTACIVRSADIAKRSGPLRCLSCRPVRVRGAVAPKGEGKVPAHITRKRRDAALIHARARANATGKRTKRELSEVLASLSADERAAVAASPHVISAIEKIVEAMLFRFS